MSHSTFPRNIVITQDKKKYSSSDSGLSENK